MYKKLNVLIIAALLVFVVTRAYAPDDKTPAKPQDIEKRLMKIEKKLDELIKATESINTKLDAMEKEQQKIEGLIRTRS